MNNGNPSAAPNTWKSPNNGQAFQSRGVSLPGGLPPIDDLPRNVGLQPNSSQPNQQGKNGNASQAPRGQQPSGSDQSGSGSFFGWMFSTRTPNEQGEHPARGSGGNNNGIQNPAGSMQSPQYQFSSTMSSPSLSPNAAQGPRNDGQRGASSDNAAQRTPGFDPVTSLQHQLQSFNFGAARGGVSPNGGQSQSPTQPGQGHLEGSQRFQQPPGAMNPGPSRDNPQAGQWPPGGQQQPSLPSGTPGMPPNGARHQSSAQLGQSNPTGAQYPQQSQFNGAPPNGLGNSGPQNNASSAGPNNPPRPPQQSSLGQANPNAPPNASNVGANRAISQPNVPSNLNLHQNPQQQSQSNLNGAAAPFSAYGPFAQNISAGNGQGNPQQMSLQGQSSSSNFAMPQPPQPGAAQSSFGISQGQSHPSNLAMPHSPQPGPVQSNPGGPQGQSLPSNFALPQQPQPGMGQSNLGASQSQLQPSNLTMPQPPRPGAGQSNASANASGSQSAQRSSLGGNQPNIGSLPPVLIPPAPNQRQQENRMSMGSGSPMSERMGPPPIIPPPSGGHPQDPFQAINFNQANLGRGAQQTILSSQPNPGGAGGQSLDPTTFGAYPGQGQQPQATPTQAAPRASLNGSQQLGQHAQQQVPSSNQVFIDPRVQAMVNQELQSNILQGLTIPLYPAPPDITAGYQQSFGDHIYQAMLVELANCLHQWSQSFDGVAVKTLTPQHEAIIRGCLDIFAPMESGIVTSLNTEHLSIEGLYYSPSHRRILAEHIVALNVHIFIFSPFFPGVNIPVGKLLASITDRLYLNPATVNTDLEWRQAVCRDLSAQVEPHIPMTQTITKLMPVLQALYPHETPVQWAPLMGILQRLVNVLRQMKVEKDIYAPFFSTKGSPKSEFEAFRGNQAGQIYLCTFSGVTRRFWDETSQSFYEILLMPAVVELESSLGG